MNQPKDPEVAPSEPHHCEDLPFEPESVPRWVQISVGVVLLPLTLLCAVGAASIFGIPKVQGDPLLQLLAAAICFLCLWAIVLAVRLLFGIRGKGGLMGPWALRAVGVAAVGLVVGGFFTGVWSEHPIRTALMSAAYVPVAIRVWRSAGNRSAR